MNKSNSALPRNSKLKVALSQEAKKVKTVITVVSPSPGTFHAVAHQELCMAGTGRGCLPNAWGNKWEGAAENLGA